MCAGFRCSMEIHHSLRARGQLAATTQRWSDITNKILCREVDSVHAVEQSSVKPAQ